MVDLGCRFFMVYAEFFTAYKGHKRLKKHLVIEMIFFTVSFHGLPLSIIKKPGNHPIFEKNALGVKRPFLEQLSEFRGILGATLGMALTT